MSDLIFGDIRLRAQGPSATSIYSDSASQSIQRMSFIFVTWHNDTAAPDFRSLDPMTACNGTLVVVGIPPLAHIINLSEVRVFLIPLEEKHTDTSMAEERL